jgi:hypothetical protein
MATLIRLKQIESGSALQTSADLGNDISASVINIVSQSIVGILPEGVVSGSPQIELLSASGYGAFTQSLDITYATDYEVYVTSSYILDQGEF